MNRDLEKGRRLPRQYRWRGRYWTIEELAATDEFKAGCGTISKFNMRMSQGWTVERAVTQAQASVAQYSFDGRHLTVKGWSMQPDVQERGITYRHIFERLSWGWSISRAVTEPVERRGAVQRGWMFGRFRNTKSLRYAEEERDERFA